MLVVHHLDNSRSQRILWLLEELALPYEIKFYKRNANNRLAPDELKAVHPLGKSPVLQDGDVKVIESGAIIEYVVRKHGGGKLAPGESSPEWPEYLQLMHYAEGSAMLPLMLALYTSFLGEGGAPLQPRIQSEIANHIGYLQTALGDREFFLVSGFSAADVQLSFVLEAARMRGGLSDYAKLSAYLDRMHARPAYKAAVEKGGPYMMGQ